MVRDSSKKRTGQYGRNSNPVATLPHATVVFHMQPFNFNMSEQCGLSIGSEMTSFNLHKNGIVLKET